MSGISDQFRRLFIGGLSYYVTETVLKSHFEQWGEIVECVILRDYHTKQSRRCGFITYKHAYMVDDAQAARPHKIDGREVLSKRAASRKDAGKPESERSADTLYIKGLKDDVTENDLRHYFGCYGNIIRVNILVGKNSGRMTGVAFIQFDDYDPVDKIVPQVHYCKGSRLIVKKAFSRQERNIFKTKVGGFERGRSHEFGRRFYGAGYENGGLVNYGVRFDVDPIYYTIGYVGISAYGDPLVTYFWCSYACGICSTGVRWGANFGCAYGCRSMGYITGYSQRSQRYCNCWH